MISLLGVDEDEAASKYNSDSTQSNAGADKAFCNSKKSIFSSASTIISNNFNSLKRIGERSNTSDKTITSEI